MVKIPGKGGVVLGVLRLITRFNEGLCGILSRIAGGILAIIVLVLFISVGMRYLFNRPLSWSGELGVILLVWMTLLGAPGGLRKGSHVSIGFLVDKLPDPGRILVRLGAILVVLFVCWMMVSRGWGFALKGMRRIVPSMPWLPFGFAYLALPAGYGMMMLVCIEIILKNATGLGRRGGECPSI